MGSVTDTPTAAQRALLRTDNWRMLGKLSIIAVMMFGFGFALVPMYRALCDALGLNVLARAERQQAGMSDAVNTQVDSSRTVLVEFDASARGPWDFKPEVAAVRVHPGQMATVLYEFHNKQNRIMAAQAIPSYAPAQSMAYFHKLECFCFTEQILQPGESRRWPVSFVVDAKLPKDVGTITLSYTFFEVGGRVPAPPPGGPQAAADLAAGPNS